MLGIGLVYQIILSPLTIHTYLDLGPPVPVGTLGDEVPPSGTVVGNHHGFFTILRSSRSVSCHVFLGLPLRLFPPSGIHCNAVLAGLDGGSRSVRPMNLLRLSATMSCRSLIPVLCSRSAFVTWSFQLIPSIFLRHLLLKTSNMRRVFSVVFQVSPA